MKPEYETLFKELEPQVRAVLAKVGLSFDDPEVHAVLSEPCDFDTFNERLDALIALKRARKPAASPAVERGHELFSRTRIGDIPEAAIVYAGYLCTKFGMCGEVMLTGYVVYAQIAEGLECDDILYKVTPEVRAEWDRAQLEYERVEENGRIYVRKKPA